MMYMKKQAHHNCHVINSIYMVSDYVIIDMVFIIDLITDVATAL